MKQTVKKKYRLKISAATENLEIIRDFINRLAKKAGFNDEQVDQIELSVDEACTNVIKHAYKYDARKMIEIDVFIDPEKIEIMITDRGNGFDLSKLAKPKLDEFIKHARPGGLGIHLMKKLMDKVKFNIEPGKKTQVSLIKYRSQKGSKK